MQTNLQSCRRTDGQKRAATSPLLIPDSFELRVSGVHGPASTVPPGSPAGIRTASAPARESNRPPSRRVALKTTPRPSRQGPETIDRSLGSLDRGEPTLHVEQPSIIPLARFLAQGAFGLFQFPI